MPRFILASASPRRRELLESAGFVFDIQAAGVVEHEDPETDPRVMVAHNAALKADWVAERNPEAVVLGADTTVFIDGHALNKPADLDDARCMLRRLCGRTHTVHTGLAIRQRSSGLALDGGVSTAVRFKPFDEATLEAYLKVAHVLDKAGAYGIQEHGELIVEGYDGSYSNIVGLPVDETCRLLAKAGLYPGSQRITT
ncbi:septum formation protein Maf [mine drainage metagenome]|uniref:Septum formation protein Maf n=1 Tax=mine drainage metagenome TaxID=410659 RepID=A0A1J5SHA7_9ZZZZ